MKNNIGVLLRKMAVYFCRILSVKMYPGKLPWILVAAFVRIFIKTIDEYAVSGVNVKAPATQSQIAASFIYNKKEK